MRVATADRAAFLVMASKVHDIAGRCERTAETDMGLLLYAQARKFHKATKELRELDFWLQQVVAEIKTEIEADPDTPAYAAARDGFMRNTEGNGA